MNRKIFWSILAVFTCLALVFLMGCSSSSRTTTQAIAITATGGASQSTTVGTAFATALMATVTTNGTPTNGATVTFAAATSTTGASCTLSATSVTTDTNGNATVTCTANSTTGTYNVTATTTGATTPATFVLTNTAVTVTTATYVFYLSGMETNSPTGLLANFYTLAGAVTLNTATGTVTGGEQDYNDGTGITSPGEPDTPDQITGGSLLVNSTGQGTLTLTTNNSGINSGTETLGVQFVNTNHALITQFDGNGTSSGSMDLQTAASPSGNFAFTASGVDSCVANPCSNGTVSQGDAPVGLGGVFTATSSGSNINIAGVVDVNDNGTVVTGTAFTASASTPDSYGRGVVTGFVNPALQTSLTLAYYVVGGEALRIIDVDTTDAAVGSAFGQGTTTYTNSSLGSSVFAVESNPWGNPAVAVGQFATSNNSNFSGVGDDVTDVGMVDTAAGFAGTYTISNAVGSVTYNGYSNMSFSTPLGNDWKSGQDFAYLGLYMTDPALNLMDPNNTSGGGGALLLDLESYFPGGMGVLVPQTDTTAADFNGKYAFGGQTNSEELNGGDVCANGWEFDFVGQGSVTASNGAFAGTGLVSDPFECFASTPGDYSGVPFAGTVTPDGSNPGRYTISPLDITAVSGSPVGFTVAIYQASAGQLFWIEEDEYSVFFGPVEQQGSLTGIPVAGAKKAAVKTRAK